MSSTLGVCDRVLMSSTLCVCDRVLMCGPCQVLCVFVTEC